MGTEKREVLRHVKGEGGDAVILHGLRVLVSRDGSGWFAQGLEIDYAAGGDTLEDVQRRFEEGLLATIREHLRTYGDLRRLVRPAPQDEWHRFVIGDGQRYELIGCTTFSKEELEAIPASWPFTQICYVGDRAAA